MYAEGLMRDIIRAIQRSRKESGLEIVDTISLYICGDEKITKIAEQYRSLISEETLAREAHIGMPADNIDDYYHAHEAIDDTKYHLYIRRSS